MYTFKQIVNLRKLSFQYFLNWLHQDNRSASLSKIYYFKKNLYFLWINSLYERNWDLNFNYNCFQDINSEILSRQQPIFSLCYQSDQLLEKHGDSLFAEQKQLLQKKIPDTKARLDAVSCLFHFYSFSLECRVIWRLATITSPYDLSNFASSIP